MKNLFKDVPVYLLRIKRYWEDHYQVHRPTFEKRRYQFYAKLWNDTATEIGADVEDFGHGFLKIWKDKYWTIVLESKVMLDDHLSLRVAGNKPLVHRILKEDSFPIQNYCEYNIHQLDKAYKFLKSVNRPCVVKPAAGSGAGNGITTKISNYKRLRKASRWAATFSPRLLIEEEIPGDSYRLLYLNGELIDVVLRTPPTVIGDGQNSIKHLVQLENMERLGQSVEDITALSPLLLDYECRLCLQEWGRKLREVPDSGERVVLKTVVNQNKATENFSVLANVHPSIVEYGARIVEKFRLKLVGVDLITPDISKPLNEVGGVINEINTNPGLHHHYLIGNKKEGIPVAKVILEYLLSDEYHHQYQTGKSVVN